MAVLTASERRETIIELLCIRRKDTISNLAKELCVSSRTIRYDIEILSCTYPLETIKGRYGGGIKVMDGYYLGRNYLKPQQEELLAKILPTLQGEDVDVLKSMLSDFALKK